MGGRREAADTVTYFELCVEMRIVSALAETAGFTGEEDGRVGFAEEGDGDKC